MTTFIVAYRHLVLVIVISQSIAKSNLVPTENSNIADISQSIEIAVVYNVLFVVSGCKIQRSFKCSQVKGYIYKQM